MSGSADRDPARSSGSAGRRLLLGYQLLDRQIIDRNARLAGKVDDLELTVPDDGGPPVVTAILSGRGALAERLGGRLGRAAVSLSRRLLPDEQGHERIWFGDVSAIDDHVEVAADAEDLATNAIEQAVRQTFIERIPGSGGRHAAE